MINAPKAILLTRVLSDGFQIPAQDKGSRGQKHQSQVPIYRNCHLLKPRNGEARFTYKKT